MKTTTMRRTVGIGAATLVAILVTLVMAFAAFAAAPAQVRGIDTNSISSQDKTTQILALEGKAGDTIYVDIFDESGNMLAQRISYSLESGKTIGALFIKDLSPELAAKGYTFKVYAGQKDKTAIFEGTVYPVYAQAGTQTKIIGVRTLAAGESRMFYPEESLYIDGVNYALQHDASGAPSYTGNLDGVMTFIYSAYTPETSATGTITYVDETGKAVLTTQYPGIATGASRTVSIPHAIIDDNSNTYRVIYYQTSVTLSNPSQLSTTSSVVRPLCQTSILAIMLRR